MSAFTQTAYLGTSLSNGNPNGQCINNYDNMGYVLGTSSTLFNDGCSLSSGPLQEIVEFLDYLVTSAGAGQDLVATYPNPFQNYKGSPLVAAQAELDLVDGGETLQNNPIWPLLHRNVDVAIVNDNSADTATLFPNGSEILSTYIQAQSAGLMRMPPIPSVDTFISEGLNQRPTFFGCNNPDVMTIIYLPNQDYTFASNQSTFKESYTVEETDGMIANGVQIATKGGDQQWPLCLACGIMGKTGGQLPDGCQACLDEYCYLSETGNRYS